MAKGKAKGSSKAQSQKGPAITFAKGGSTKSGGNSKSAASPSKANVGV